MRSAAAAIAWEFRQRHRWGLVALLVYFLVLAAIKVFVFTSGHAITFRDEQSFALMVVVPMSATFMYFLAVFSYGLSGDAAGRQSVYPQRMFTLPVTTSALAGWPMLYGCASMAILWLGTRFLGVWPAGVYVPLWWPTLLGPSLIAWTQALTWMPYPLRGMRVGVSVLWLTVIDAIVMAALEFKATDRVMLLLLAPNVPLAYLTARYAVGRARRGDIPDWSGIFGSRRSAARVRKPFASPSHAQVWFEWRQHGRSLPAMVAIVVPLELGLLFVFSETPPIIFETIMLVLFTPPFMAAFVAATVSKSSAESESSGVSPFIATRPLSDASLIAAKLKATVWSTLAAWLVVVIALPLAVRLSGTAPEVMEHLRGLAKIMGTPRATLLLLLGLLLFIASTWKQLVQSLYLGLSGREWAVKAAVFVAMSFLAIALPLAHWVVHDKEARAALWRALPWIFAVLVCVKTAIAAWIAVRLHASRLLRDRTLILGALGWNACVLTLYGLLASLFPDLILRHYFLAFVAILAIPLARLSAAPLALAWNRHQ